MVWFRSVYAVCLVAFLLCVVSRLGFAMWLFPDIFKTIFNSFLCAKLCRKTGQFILQVVTPEVRLTFLNLKAPSKICSRRYSDFSFFIFFRENKFWHFLWIVCQADDSYKMSRLVFSKKNNNKKQTKNQKKKKKLGVCCCCDWRFKS